MQIQEYLLIFSAILIVIQLIITIILLIKYSTQTNNLEEISSNFKNSLNELTQANSVLKSDLQKTLNLLETFEKRVFDEFARTRVESSGHAKQNRDDINLALKDIRESLEKHLRDLMSDNRKQLDEMRKTVDEKLEKTLNARLSQSFETVGKQLQSVQQGLGEMKNLAKDVGGLKKVLGNVKLRGGLGEMQLSMLLEQILAPDQYEANVKTKKGGSNDLVEFAVKLPGRDEGTDYIWLPVDAKFPKDVYQKLQEAQEEGDTAGCVLARKNLEKTIKNMAKDISSKYIDPPNTTDFAIMFLPFEGIYAEVVQHAALLEDIQRTHGVLVTGPSTLAAILNSLQMGFKTLAIQKRSSQVWTTLGEVKKEFATFEGLMTKAQKNIKTGLNQLDDLMGVRTRAITRKLKAVETLDVSQKQKLISDEFPDQIS